MTEEIPTARRKKSKAVGKREPGRKNARRKGIKRKGIKKVIKKK